MKKKYNSSVHQVEKRAFWLPFFARLGIGAKSVGTAIQNANSAGGPENPNHPSIRHPNANRLSGSYFRYIICQREIVSR